VEKKGMVKLSVIERSKTLCRQITYVLDENVLSAGTKKCVVYRLYSPITNNIRYFYGGGFYNKSRKELILRIDYLRPHKYQIFMASDIRYLKFDGTALDILLKDGSWISSIVLPKIRSDKCNFLQAKFDDHNLIEKIGNANVVVLPMLEISLTDIKCSRQEICLPTELFKYDFPLTYAYTKEGDDIFIGFWDIVNSKFVGTLQKYGRRLLDIGL
jgi:hypothetical protein